jgi:hypothetical protein
MRSARRYHLRTFAPPRWRNLNFDRVASVEDRRREMQRLAPVSLVPSPKPTDPPDATLVARRLQQRSISSTTCGWVNGDFGTRDPFHKSPFACLGVSDTDLFFFYCSIASDLRGGRVVLLVHFSERARLLRRSLRLFPPHSMSGLDRLRHCVQYNLPK